MSLGSCLPRVTVAVVAVAFVALVIDIAGTAKKYLSIHANPRYALLR